LTIDLDATLITSHSDKEGAAGNFKGGYGFHPMLAYADETGEALGGELRPGNAGANTAADQIMVAEQALAQIPAEHIEQMEVGLRVDSAGACHELLDWCREARIAFSVGYDLTETVREAILDIPDGDWVSALDQDATQRPNGHVCEITEHLDLAAWPAGSRVLVRRERAHPAASSRSPTTTGIASKRSSPTRPPRSPPSSATIAPARVSRTTSATTKTPACATCPSATSSTTASGLRSSASPTTSSRGPNDCC
jgi:hypothetical protein